LCKNSFLPFDDDNFADDEYFYAPFITAETQLPILGIGIAARGTSYNDFESLGGGLKWTGNVATIHLAAGLFYDRFKTDYYDGDHFSASASASLDLVVLTPYIGIGYDYSEMETKHFLTNHKTDDDVEVEKLKNQVKALEAKNSKLTALQTATKHKEDPLVDAEWNKTMNRRAYMDDMWAIRERS
jgi:hypothetical protein